MDCQNKFFPDEEYSIVWCLGTFDTKPNERPNGYLNISVEFVEILRGFFILLSHFDWCLFITHKTCSSLPLLRAQAPLRNSPLRPLYPAFLASKVVCEFLILGPECSKPSLGIGD